MSLLKMKLFVVLLYYYVFLLLITVKVGVLEYVILMAGKICYTYSNKQNEISVTF